MKHLRKTIIKLLVSAIIFLLMGWIIYPDKPIFNEGFYYAFSGAAIFFIGEAIWKAYQSKNNKDYEL
jgi:hypothetical protein